MERAVVAVLLSQLEAGTSLIINNYFLIQPYFVDLPQPAFELRARILKQITHKNFMSVTV